MSESVALVFDCGSTNLRVAAVNSSGNIVAQANRPNSPIPQPGGKPGWLIWDVDAIWLKLCLLCREVLKTLDEKYRVEAVTVTTWGADGALVRRDGSLAYPAISWQCPRTREIAEKLPELMDPWDIFRVTGYQIISFNTLLKLMWIRQHDSSAFDNAYTWLMMPGLLVHRLTGEFHIDPTSASTMMAMNMAKRDWSEEMLGLAGLDPGFFPEWVEPGEVIGYVAKTACKKTGLKESLPVVVSGHDTQFAIFAAGAGPREAVLSSGTWEILALRLDRYEASRRAFEEGVIVEADVQPGLWNPQLLMIASAVLEWVKRHMYPELKPSEYKPMIEEASRIPPGSGGILAVTSFVSDSGPTRKYGAKGAFLGLELQTGRGHIYRAALEGLSLQLRLALEALEEAYGFKAESVRVVGGGSKNHLWNQIRADVLGLPITTTRFSEATVLGAALTAFTGTGLFKDFNDALKSMKWDTKMFKPGAAKKLYDRLYGLYVNVLQTLKPIYENWTH